MQQQLSDLRRVPLDHGGAALVHVSPDGSRLVDVTPPPECPNLLWQDLTGLLMPDVSSIAVTLDARQRAARAGRPQRTLIDRVMLSKETFLAWRHAVADYIAAHPDTNPEACGEETVVPLSDGRLLLYATVPEGELSITVAAGDWRWIEAS